MLNQFRATNIVWDKASLKLYAAIRASSSDENGRKLVVQVINKGVTENLENTSLSLYWEQGETKGLDSFNLIDAKNGIYELYFRTGMLKHVGKLNAHLHLVDTTGAITSEPFTIYVFKGVDVDAMASDDELSALTQALVQVNNLETTYAPRLTAAEQSIVENHNQVTAQLEQKAQQSALEIEKARIDNLVANAGDVTNNADLLDIRVGADGETYSSAGESIRKQFISAKENLTKETENTKRLLNPFVKESMNNLVYTDTFKRTEGVNTTITEDYGDKIKSIDFSALTNKNSGVRYVFSLKANRKYLFLIRLAVTKPDSNGKNVRLSTYSSGVTWKNLYVFTGRQIYDNGSKVLDSINTTTQLPEALYGYVATPTEDVTEAKFTTVVTDNETGANGDAIFTYRCVQVIDVTDFSDADSIQNIIYHGYNKISKVDKKAETLDYAMPKAIAYKVEKDTKEYEQNKVMFESLKTVKTGANEQIEIRVPNDTNEIKRNMTIRVALHRGAQEGDVVWNEIFSNQFQKGFNGLRFFEGEKELPYSIMSSGNWDFIRDSRLRQYGNQGVFALSTGEIIFSNNSRKVKKTLDNGKTFVNPGTVEIDGILRFVDSKDNIYVQNVNYQLVKYSKPNYSDGIVALDLSSTQSDIPHPTCDEDSNGYIYVGRYQEPWGIGAGIYRSIDGGNSFQLVYENLEKQHVHHIRINKSVTPNEIYAGLDDSNTRYGPFCIKSIDSGVTWSIVPIPYRNRDFAFNYFGNGYKLGGGEANILGGATIFKTTNENDAGAYKTVLDTSQGIREIFSPKEGMIVCGGVAGGTNKIAQLYLSEDEGENWRTIYADESESITNTSAGNGYRLNTDYFMPTGATEKQVILSGNGRPFALRFYIGGNREFALVYVNVGDIPVGGKTIKLDTNYLLSTSSLYDTHSEIVTPLYKINLNEGFGKTTQTTNGRIEVNNIDTWEEINSCIGGMTPSIARNRFGAILKNNAYATIGKIPLGRSKNFSISFWLKVPPNAEEDIYSNTIKKYILNSGAVSIYIQGRALCFEINGIKSSIHLPDTMWNSSGMWRYCIVTIDNETLPNMCAYTYDKLEKTNKASAWGTSPFSSQTFTLGKPVYLGGEQMYNGIADIRIYNKCLTYEEAVAINQGRYYLLHQN